MIRRKNILLETALACLHRGIPVQAAPLSALPEEGAWITSSDAAIAVWNMSEPPNLAVSSCAAVAIWRLPRIAGAYGNRLYEQQRPGVWPPTMKLPDGDWLTCTLQPTGDLGPLAAGVEYIVPGTPAVIPPSRAAGGRRLRWDGSRFPIHPLPAADAVLSQVLIAEQEYMELHGQRG